VAYALDIAVWALNLRRLLAGMSVGQRVFPDSCPVLSDLAQFHRPRLFEALSQLLDAPAGWPATFDSSLARRMMSYVMINELT